MPQIIWTDHSRRLVLTDGDYKLEVREGDVDAMGKPHWRSTELTWELFRAILKSVLAWVPVQLNPDELS